ncbi:AMP-binding protein [Acinetobacter sp. MD2]|uniref:AMP-binding protein n=1 Tax=Acinetobacter sp. MD2 TaxID=2600066 RepID=UPI002D1F0E80|nr:AMP-binding protein [Acinetobacter sp. MD2]MEB3767076.1 AMP-binding protein [Acinetobacter sp. MD2]
MKNVHFNAYLTAERPLCFDAQVQPILFSAFWQDVAAQAHTIATLPATQFALWESDSYEFLVLFFASVVAKKRVILPPNQVQQLQQQLAEQGIAFLQRQAHVVAAQVQPISDELLQHSEIVFFTSGSTGQPKQILRSLQQLLAEVQGLASSFSLPEQAVAIATVSHQHIYGLLFKVLLPLATGRIFYREQLIYPEYVVQAQQQLHRQGYLNFVISSPALLKRWSDTVELQHCAAVYSSGGKLESGIRANINITVTEVFGSSETGGIAYRHADDALWQPFSNVDVSSDAQMQLSIRSLHACETTNWVATGDRVELIQPNNLKSPFRLLGRVDRIVKLEEKRLSLDEIEQKIQQLEAIEQCHVLLIPHQQRCLLGCVAVLNTDVVAALKTHGKAAMVSQIKQQLQPILERLAIPRQWRFVSQLPQNSQSKLNRNDMLQLFQDPQYPLVLSSQHEAEKVIFQLEFLPELQCFKGHFPHHPIYPGVGQIAFLQHFARQVWGDLAHCCGCEQLKFQDLICPYDVLELNLVRAQHKVEFQLKKAEKTLASGRLLFTLHEELGA